MKNKLIVNLSNDIGNQMFMYAAGYSFSEHMKRELYIDDETTYKKLKNIYRYKLDIFNLSGKKAPKDLKFLGIDGYIRKKILRFSDKFKKNKKFFREYKDKNKITCFNDNFLNHRFDKNLFLDGHFESEKYFFSIKDKIRKEFTFKNRDTFKKDKLYLELANSESVCICIRQHRFSEKVHKITKYDVEKSLNFVKEQVNYIKIACEFIKQKISNPKFYLWTNDHANLSHLFPSNFYTLIKKRDVDIDLFLMTQAKHFIVIPSTFNWWGAWLSDNNNKIVVRPSNNFFNNFKINNNDFWPDKWIKLNK